MVEISCPSGCGYLAAAREHPAAVVKRQQERDIAMLLPTIRHLTERQHQLFFIFQTAIARHTPDAFARLIDDDVADAAGAVAATLETAARGVIYEHPAHSLVAQRLGSELQAVLDEMRRHGATVYEGEAALVLRAIERGARETRKLAGADPTAYLALVDRLLQVNRAAPEVASSEPAARLASPIVLP